jgi:hypothetical protein
MMKGPTWTVLVQRRSSLEVRRLKNQRPGASGSLRALVASPGRSATWSGRREEPELQSTE